MDKIIFDTAGDISTGAIKWSADIQNQIEEGKLKKEDILNNQLDNFLNQDFGKVTPQIAEQFKASFDEGTDDIYGIYDNIVIYYDAEDDDLTVLSRDEFLRFYRNDWLRKERLPFNMRYGGPRLNVFKKGQQLKEGQRQAIVEKGLEELGGKATGSEKYFRLDNKVYPYLDNYDRVVKVLSTEQLDNLKALAEAKNIKLSKILSIIGFQHYVQHKNTSDSYDYILRLIEKDAAALKSRDSLRRKKNG